MYSLITFTNPGEITEMYTSQRTYTYPARVARTFFELAERHAAIQKEVEGSQTANHQEDFEEEVPVETVAREIAVMA
jgi:hypothetical protein